MEFVGKVSKFAGEKDGYVYTRNGNPTISVSEHRVAMLQGGVEAMTPMSGHAAQLCYTGALVNMHSFG
ncbi:hypothetical protein BKA65DRAFT_394667 [Rhexocercosporidium sp. MPI-PUGE-AT-0058]|nr:hypothetical protein BKA65DRAFT_394667 [Rhexocercosporidium sp. MPI-PUGE-AT-0058]